MSETMTVWVLAINSRGDRERLGLELRVNDGHRDGVDVAGADDADRVVDRFLGRFRHAVDDFLLLAFVQAVKRRTHIAEFKQRGGHQVMNQQLMGNHGRLISAQLCAFDNCIVFSFHGHSSVLGDALKLRLLSWAQVGMGAVTLEAGADVLDEFQFPFPAGVQLSGGQDPGELLDTVVDVEDGLGGHQAAANWACTAWMWLTRAVQMREKSLSRYSVAPRSRAAASKPSELMKLADTTKPRRSLRSPSLKCRPSSTGC